MTGYCVMGEHADCPDTAEDSFTCSCPCHLATNDPEGDDQ
jgi:hypothetical protein